MFVKALKILLAFILLSAFMLGLFGMSLCVLVGCGILVLGSVFVGYIVKNCVIAILRFSKRIFASCKRHPQICKWVLFGIYTICLLWPFALEIINHITYDGFCNHWYFVILGTSLIAYIAWYWGGEIRNSYVEYKQTYTDKNNFSIWGTNDMGITFIDYFLNNYYDIKKQSFYWLRRFLTIYCYPCFLLGYVICLTNDENTLSSTITLGSLCIAVFSVWYSVNVKMQKESNNSVSNNMEKLEPTKIEASNRYNKEWREE